MKAVGIVLLCVCGACDEGDLIQLLFADTSWSYFVVMLKKWHQLWGWIKKKFLPSQTEGGLVSPTPIITPPPSMQMSCKW